MGSIDMADLSVSKNGIDIVISRHHESTKVRRMRVSVATVSGRIANGFQSRVSQQGHQPQIMPCLHCTAIQIGISTPHSQTRLVVVLGMSAALNSALRP